MEHIINIDEKVDIMREMYANPNHQQPTYNSGTVVDLDHNKYLDTHLTYK